MTIHLTSHTRNPVMNIVLVHRMHWELFPHGHKLPPGVVEEINGILLHALTGNVRLCLVILHYLP